MGVNVSKDDGKKVIRATESENNLEVESIETLSRSVESLPGTVHSIISSCSNTYSGNNSDVVSQGERSQKSMGQNELQLEEVSSDEQLQIVRTRNEPDRKAKLNSQKNNSTRSAPLSDAEKRLRMYEEEMRAQRSSNGNTTKHAVQQDQIYGPPLEVPIMKKTKPHLFLKNNDILKVKRTGVFSSESLLTKDLNPVNSRKPGQSDILYQLGREGIVKPMSEEERTKGELRSVGILNQTIEDNQSKKTYPRLAPLKVESVWARVPEANLPAPWERDDCLRTDNKQKPPIDGSIPLKDFAVKENLEPNDATKLKFKMMNMDLL